MRGYAAIFAARLRSLLRYRAAAWAGIGTQLVFGVVLIATRSAYYEVASEPPPIRWEQMVTYSWLAQAFFAMSPFTANPDPDIRKMITDGTVAYELARPLDLYSLWFSRQVANRLAPTLLRCGPILVLGLLWLGLQPPPSFGAAAAFLVTMVGALLLIAAWTTLIAISLLWTLSGDGIARSAPVLVMICSGQLLPLALYPEPLRVVFGWLPFRGMVDDPFSLWTGALPVSQVGVVLFGQLLWTAALVGAGRTLLNRGLRRLVVQGG